MTKMNKAVEVVAPVVAVLADNGFGTPTLKEMKMETLKDNKIEQNEINKTIKLNKGNEMKMTKMTDLWTVATDMKRTQKAVSVQAQIDFIMNRQEEKRINKEAKALAHALKTAKLQANKEIGHAVSNVIESVKVLTPTEEYVMFKSTKINNTRLAIEVTEKSVKVVPTIHIQNNNGAEFDVKALGFMDMEFLSSAVVYHDESVAVSVMDESAAIMVMPEEEVVAVVVEEDKGYKAPVWPVLSDADRIIGNGKLVGNYGDIKQKEDGMWEFVDGNISVVNGMSIKLDGVSTDGKEGKETMVINNVVRENGVFMDIDGDDAMCSNFDCVSRDKTVIINALTAEMRVLEERVNKGQKMMMKEYSALVKKHTMGVVTKKPTVINGTDIVVSKYSMFDTVPANSRTIDMLATQLMYSHYKSGDVNPTNKAKFTTFFGYAEGIKRFNAYAEDCKTLRGFISLTFEILKAKKAVRIKRDEAFQMENVMTTITVEERMDTDEHITKCCPVCGGEVIVYKGNRHFKDATKDMVINELKDETYNCSTEEGERFVTLGDIKGNIVVLNDTAEDMALDATNDVEFGMDVFDDADGFEYTSAFDDSMDDMDVFDDDFESKQAEFYNTEVEGYQGNEYKESLITNESAQDMWGEGGDDFTDEEILAYNKTIQTHQNANKWSKYRGAYGVLESGEYTRTTISEVSVAGGWLSKFYDYEVETLCDAGTELGYAVKTKDTVNANAIAVFYANVGKVFANMDMDVVDGLNESHAAMEWYDDSFNASQSATRARGTIKDLEGKKQDLAMLRRYLAADIKAGKKMDNDSLAAYARIKDMDLTVSLRNSTSHGISGVPIAPVVARSN